MSGGRCGGKIEKVTGALRAEMRRVRGIGRKRAASQVAQPTPLRFASSINTSA
jgi:hypothetical protein